MHPLLRISLPVGLFFALAPLAHGATLYVANNGIDPPGCVPSFCVVGHPCGCGTKASPCRSITCGIMTAAAGDTIIVGPGTYGDLNGDGVVPDFPGEETPSPGCDCMIAVNKGVTLLSSDGAAATTIDATTMSVDSNVIIIADGVTFGKPGKGFTLTETFRSPPVTADNGLAIDASKVIIQGNQVLNAGLFAFGKVGIKTVDNDGETILIQGNQVVGWETGIWAGSSGKTVTKNHVALSSIDGIVAKHAASVVGNVVGGKGTGGAVQITDSVTATGNAVVGDDVGFVVVAPFSGTLANNNIVANGNGARDCGLVNSGVAGLVAANNYWGAATGPGPVPADDVCNENNGTTTVTPFATKPFTVKAPIKP